MLVSLLEIPIIHKDLSICPKSPIGEKNHAQNTDGDGRDDIGDTIGVSRGNSSKEPDPSLAERTQYLNNIMIFTSSVYHYITQGQC
jgi:hypothetical protein